MTCIDSQSGQIQSLIPPETLTKCCIKPMARHATFDLWRNSPNGIIGFLVSRLSLKRKKKVMSTPTTMRQMTLGESQGKVVPPKLSPSNTITMRPTIDTQPAQSMNLIPSENFVLGLCTSRNRNRRRNAGPHTGKLIQKIHLHDKSWVKAPPRTGPRPPATA